MRWFRNYDRKRSPVATKQSSRLPHPQEQFSKLYKDESAANRRRKLDDIEGALGRSLTRSERITTVREIDSDLYRSQAPEIRHHVLGDIEHMKHTRDLARTVEDAEAGLGTVPHEQMSSEFQP